MKMFCAGQWQDTNQTINVTNPFDQSVVDTVPQGSQEDIARAVTVLEQGARIMKAMTPFDRAQILQKASELMLQRKEELARTISLEVGKILGESQVEAVRSAEVIRLSGEEARRMTGEMIPLEGNAGGQNKLGFTLRVPCGIVAAITPFNFPLNLVCHKVGPAIAAGNAILIKPASDTPLSALKLTEILLEAGLPPEAIACITGPGGEIGHAICTDTRIRKISFTGSYEVGTQICEMAGMKRVTMELGSNSPVVIMDDADLEKAATAITMAGYANAGQVCISAQRILTSSAIKTDFVDLLKSKVEALTTGDQLNDSTKVGPMVRESDATRVEQWVDEAIDQGARLVCGGQRQGAIYAPTILDETKPDMLVVKDEIFGPAVALSYFDNVNDAIAMANDTIYGLSAGIFTQDIDRAMKFAREVDSGNIHINWSSQWRADAMPYGGLKYSGTGKEGPKYAIHEMSEEKMVVMHLAD
ncbi:MAG: aldehyde dehydrogenase family protein [Planctomycetes bacterium]|nr:aldehyde dehydrogenase family protein [Planctomycetota bacterium]MCH9727321.1 aldehyde dehydrogenase family protein [Planctomycetota bacterium]MCH9777019.1 aldehyde dehydrogenase family protein [Planctomycetota bacterium]MCH9792094.1 aldehyde dehydrogenase family protein [Planctomycetota bacterium]MDF1746035.1 aldehyde dehydrogenase family protein [Gimesia sp.]